ncbi:MAG: tRNA lysidine(34) synthetase TilS [Gammaproteobacteria bacterium]|nr:tRNA lysidine(34) synthetase TilS [Gammaproteobacteria bacterium]MCW5583792.1 tRNA lysidine(34) synthetase TilS [Gammaproteobacteria bacterium]
MTLLDAVSNFCRQCGVNKKYWIAFSGGLDSHVLLYLCKILQAELNINFNAIHVNHGLSKHAQSWARHCKKICNEYAIKYHERIIQLDLNIGDSLEEIAREKRYAAFAEYIGEEEILLTAHQQDDQAETMLLQLLRGAGPKGLAAMPQMKSFARGFHGRPLLHFSRFDLQQYAEMQQLDWIKDESNGDLSYTRNFIRHEILTKLKSRWPTVTATLSRSAAHCAESQVLLEKFAKEMYEQVQGTAETTLSVDKLTQVSPERQRLLLRTWIQYLGYPLPDTKKIETIQRDILTAARDRMPCVKWGKVELRRYRDDLHLLPALQAIDTQQVFSWDLAQSLRLPGVGILRTAYTQGRGLRADIQHVLVQYRQGGEVVELLSRGRHTLKNLFQEWNVLPWERDRVPLIFFAGKLIAAMGYFFDEKFFIVQSNELGREVIFERA